MTTEISFTVKMMSHSTGNKSTTTRPPPQRQKCICKKSATKSIIDTTIRISLSISIILLLLSSFSSNHHNHKVEAKPVPTPSPEPAPTPVPGPVIAAEELESNSRECYDRCDCGMKRIDLRIKCFTDCLAKCLV